MRVKKFRRQKLNLDPNQRRHTSPTPRVMVWGGILCSSQATLLFISGSLNGRQYIDLMLQPIVVAYVKEINNVIFQQDNACPHTAVMTITLL